MSRPYAAQRANYGPPTPTLSLDEAAIVRRLERGEPLAVGRDIPLSVALRLSAIGAILIGDDQVALFNPEEVPF